MKNFVLTRDMCPIHYISDDRKTVAFICPLPLGFEEVVANFISELPSKISEIVKSVNRKALNLEPPFENILIEYSERSEKQQKELLSGFQIRDYSVDSRGLYSVAIHGAYGDIYLDRQSHNCCDFISDGFREFFEPNVAFQCHNVDYYWQALLTREVAVEYFNLLSSLRRAIK